MPTHFFKFLSLETYLGLDRIRIGSGSSKAWVRIWIQLSTLIWIRIQGIWIQNSLFHRPRGVLIKYSFPVYCDWIQEAGAGGNREVSDLFRQLCGSPQVTKLTSYAMIFVFCQTRGNETSKKIRQYDDVGRLHLGLELTFFRLPGKGGTYPPNF